MNSTFRKALVPGVAVLALALTACGAGNEESSAGASNASGDAKLSGTLAGGGASSQEKGQNAWVAGFQTANPDVTINYDPVGSGTGRKNFASGGFKFAGTDSALTDKEGELTAAKEQCASDVIQVPAYVSPIAVAFNLDGITELNLSGKVIADIFNNKITTWNDPAIAEANPGAKLPDLAIVPVHRVDDSGTTENFTKYLQAAGEGAWAEEPDGEWPSSIKGEAAEGTSGVVGIVKDKVGAITYADHSATEGLGLVSVKVGQDYVPPTAEGAAKVLAISPAAEGVGATDMAVDLARDTTEAGAYPVVLVSYLLACSSYSDAKDGELVKGYLSYVLSEEGQKAAEAEAGSAPLDAEVAQKAQALVDAIK